MEIRKITSLLFEENSVKNTKTIQKQPNDKHIKLYFTNSLYNQREFTQHQCLNNMAKKDFPVLKEAKNKKILRSVN